MSNLETRASRHGEPKRRMSGAKKALIGLGVLLLVLILAVAAVGLGIRHSINSQIQHIPSAIPSQSGGSTSGESDDQSGQSDSEGGDPINFLILGSDSRQSGGDPTDWQYGGQRSDVMMLVQVSGDRQRLTVMSIPRDSWVDIPGHGTAKINAAFSYGGAPLAVETVQNLTGVSIDHVAIVDFTSFQELTDQLGGVTIQTADGEKTMNGDEALSFVRERYSLPGGDFDRVRRQQAWIHAIMSRVFERGVLSSPSQISPLIQTVLQYSAVDEGLDFDSLLSLAVSMRGLRADGVTFLTAPVIGTDTSADGQSIVVLDDATLAGLMDAWRADDVADFLADHPEVRTLDSGPVY